jgi:hypothetical protein
MLFQAIDKATTSRRSEEAFPEVRSLDCKLARWSIDGKVNHYLLFQSATTVCPLACCLCIPSALTSSGHVDKNIEALLQERCFSRKACSHHCRLYSSIQVTQMSCCAGMHKASGGFQGLSPWRGSGQSPALACSLTYLRDATVRGRDWVLSQMPWGERPVGMVV